MLSEGAGCSSVGAFDVGCDWEASWAGAVVEDVDAVVALCDFELVAGAHEACVYVDAAGGWVAESVAGGGADEAACVSGGVVYVGLDSLEAAA